jgi:23S rRNA pseudouridine2457 synthase
VQADGDITEEAVAQLEQGLEIRAKGKVNFTQPAQARILAEPKLPPRNPPIRYRKNIPTSWLELGLTEGKNRQVRRMMAKVGFPALRLVRYAIEDISIHGMEVGGVKEMEAGPLFEKLRLHSLKS